MNRLRGACVTLLLAVFVAACGGDDEQSDGTIPANLTLDEVYVQMEAAIAGDGDQILHARFIPDRIDYTFSNGEPTPEPPDAADVEAHADELWIDAAHESARFEPATSGVDADRLYAHIVIGDELFRVDDEGRSDDVSALRCRGSDSPLIAGLMGCGNYLEESTTVVESGERDGREMIVLYTTGELPSHDWTTPFEARLYIDPATSLPVAAELLGTRDGGAPVGYSVATRYEIEFVERSSLPDDFFEPASIGFVAQQPVPADNLSPEVNGVRVYWIGESFDAGLDGPLMLQQPTNYSDEATQGGVVSLSYDIPGNATPYRGLRVASYRLDAEDQLRVEFDAYWLGDDVAETQTTIGGAAGRIYRMEGRYGDLCRAHIYYEDTIVVVADYMGPPPYTGEAAFMRALEGLRPFEQ